MARNEKGLWCKRDGVLKKAVLSHEHMIDLRRKWLRCLEDPERDGALQWTLGTGRKAYASEAEAFQPGLVNT